MPLGMEVGLNPGDIVFDGDPASHPQKGVESPSPIFGPCLLWPNGCMDQDGTWQAGRPWSTPHCARWGPSSPPQKREQSRPHFSAHFYGGQTAGCIKMPLGMEVGLNPGDIVFDGDPASPPQKGVGSPPQLSAHVYCGQTAAWIKMALGKQVGLGPRHIVLDGDLALLPKKRSRAAPNFRPIFMVARRLDASRCHLVWR